MSDPYAAAIDTVMTGLGYQVQQVTEPKYRDYDPALPTLYVSPFGKSDVLWLAFLTVGAKQAYDLVYVYPNKLAANLADNDVWAFKNTVILQFMGLNTTMDDAGAWNVTVKDVTDYNRPLFKQGYTYSQIRVFVEYVVE